MASDDNSVSELSLRHLLGPDLLSFFDEPVDATLGKLLQAPLPFASEPVQALPAFSPASNTAALQGPAPNLDQLNQAPLPFTSVPVQTPPPQFRSANSPKLHPHSPFKHCPHSRPALVRRLLTSTTQNCANLYKIKEIKIRKGRQNLTSTFGITGATALVKVDQLEIFHQSISISSWHTFSPK